MSNAFTSFLGGVVNGVLGTGPIMKDYQHADRLYVKNTYARAPKVGFLYFVTLNINPLVIGELSGQWKNKQLYQEVGMLVKRIDLPKFSISIEQVNQYNRKANVQTTIKYNPISMDFHDDNSDITRDLWKYYFQYYYRDSIYGSSRDFTTEYSNNKYSETAVEYGLNGSQTEPFFTSIDIYQLHQQKFSKYTLVNPLVSEWGHDSLDQSDGQKVLANKMTVTYETVLYKEGTITKSSPEGFTAMYYDTSPSPLSIGGNGTNTLFGAGGILAGASAIFGGEGNLLQKAILGANVLRNAKQMGKGGLMQEGYSIITGVLGNVQQTGNQPGGVGAAVQNGLNQRGIGINLFGNQNSSVNGTTPTKPSTLTGQ